MVFDKSDFVILAFEKLEFEKNRSYGNRFLDFRFRGIGFGILGGYPWA